MCGGNAGRLNQSLFRMPFRLRTKNSFGEMESFHFGILGNAEDIQLHPLLRLFSVYNNTALTDKMAAQVYTSWSF